MEFKQKFSKSYSSLEEEEARFAIFSGKLQRIEEHNSAEGVKYRKGDRTLQYLPPALLPQE